MKAVIRFITTVLLSVSLVRAVPLTCPAGMPIGNVQLRVQAGKGGPSRALRGMNRIQEGDKLLYQPSAVRNGEKRKGKVAVVIVPAPPAAKAEEKLIVLDPKSASAPQQWTIPVRVSIIAFVYGPDGLDAKKVRSQLTKDDELIAQLADYAEKTQQTEQLLQVLASWNQQDPSQSVDAALNGFASQYGLSNKLDRTQPTDQQTLALMRSLNPALATYDPLAPQAPQRVQQTASLMTTVAGMFFGNTVGLAAGGAALFMNMRTLMFPNTELRSTFAQTMPSEDLGLCAKRDPSKARTRLAYLWATRVPDSAAPSITIGGANYIPAGLKTPVPVKMPDNQWKLADRAHDWQLVAANGASYPVGVRAVTDQKSLEIDLSHAKVAPGDYRLRAGWDWDQFTAQGDIHVSPLSGLEKARLEPDSQDRLLEESGKTVVALHGEDFQFVEKAALVKSGDKFNQPVTVPFALPRGKRAGPQTRMELEIDTKPLSAGDYSLLLVEQDGQSRPVPVKVLPPPPKIENLPVSVNAGEKKQYVALRGDNLERILRIDAPPALVELGDLSADKQERQIQVTIPAEMKPGASLDLKAYVKDFAQPIVVSNGLKIVGPRPRIVNSKFSLPNQLEVAVRPGELPAGAFISTMLHVQNVGPETNLRLGCRTNGSTELTVRVGEQQPAARLQSMSADTLFLSFDPGSWQTGCVLEARLDNGGSGQSKPYQLGRVVRLPHVDSFKLTEEKAGENEYVGVLEGRDLETIEKAGWDSANGQPVQGIPAPIAGEGQKQALRIVLPWPAPSPHAPLYFWFRGEREGRLSSVKY